MTISERLCGGSTRFADLSPAGARVVLAAALAASTLLVAITVSPWRSGFADAPSRGPSDSLLYRAEIERMRAGEDYYLASKAEMESRGFPTRSVLNWRTPLPMWLIAVLPEGAGQGLLALIAAGVLMVAGHLVATAAGLRCAITAMIFLTGALMPAVLAGPCLMTEVWCGVLLAASLVCYGLERRGAAVGCGVAALFVRELAAPYCLVCGLIAIRERRWPEVAGWSAGAIAYAVFYAWHLSNVLPLIDADAISHDEGWLQFGGAAFVISLVQMNVYLLLLPQWISAVYLVLALLGFSALDGAWGARAAWTACAYLLAFGFFGQPFNQYWGSVMAPLFCFGAAMGVAAVVDLWRAAAIGRGAFERRGRGLTA
jgi:hypothetical protein